MPKADLQKMTADQLVALSYELGAAHDELRAKRIAVADELRSRQADADKRRAELQAEMDALSGSAVALGANLTASSTVKN